MYVNPSRYWVTVVVPWDKEVELDKLDVAGGVVVGKCELEEVCKEPLEVSKDKFGFLDLVAKEEDLDSTGSTNDETLSKLDIYWLEIKLLLVYCEL